MRRAMDSLLYTLNGWSGLAKRFAERAAKQAKRDDLNVRRVAAAAKRRAALNAWIAKTLPFGAETRSVDAWTAQFVQHDLPPPTQDLVIGSYLGETLTAASLKNTKEACVAFHAAQAAFMERKTQLVAELAVLGLDRRADSRLCRAFEAGTPISGFATPKRIADEMALMRWLHNHTNYRQELQRKVATLRDEEGHYYEGINADARDTVKAMRKFQPPTTWPWLSGHSKPLVGGNLLS